MDIKGAADGLNKPNRMMFIVAIPLVLMWLTVAVFVIYMGVTDETGRVQDNLDYFTTLIGILGGPALLFITSILEVWKGHESAQLSAMPDALAAKLETDKMMVEYDIEQKRAQHAHEIAMDAYITTNKATSKKKE
jgi:hypothetical protein